MVPSVPDVLGDDRNHVARVHSTQGHRFSSALRERNLKMPIWCFSFLASLVFHVSSFFCILLFSTGSEKYTCTSGGLCCQAAIRGKCHWTAFRSLRIFPCIAIHTAANAPPSPCLCSGLILREKWNEWKLGQFDQQTSKKWSCKRKGQRNDWYL